MTNCEAGAVVLDRFPFTDLTTSKKRPAIVLSPKSYSDRFHDVVVMSLTSQADSASIALLHWKAAGLLKPTWIKPVVGTVATRLVVHRLGKLLEADEAGVRAALAVILEPRRR